MVIQYLIFISEFHRKLKTRCLINGQYAIFFDITGYIDKYPVIKALVGPSVGTRLNNIACS